MALDTADPKRLIAESYRIEGITEPECRSIFLDWALSVGAEPPADLIRALIDRHGAECPDHPMTRVLQEGLVAPRRPARRGGRAGRLG